MLASFISKQISKNTEERENDMISLIYLYTCKIFFPSYVFTWIFISLIWNYVKSERITKYFQKAHFNPRINPCSNIDFIQYLRLCVDETVSSFLEGSRKLVYLCHRHFLVEEHRYRSKKFYTFFLWQGWITFCSSKKRRALYFQNGEDHPD